MLPCPCSTRAFSSPCSACECSLLMFWLPASSTAAPFESVLLKTGGRKPWEKLAFRCHLGSSSHTAVPENKRTGSYGRSPKAPCRRAPPSIVSLLLGRQRSEA